MITTQGEARRNGPREMRQTKKMICMEISVFLFSRVPIGTKQSRSRRVRDEKRIRRETATIHRRRKGQEIAEMTRKTKVIERNERDGEYQQDTENGNRDKMKHENGRKIGEGEKKAN